MSQGGEGDPTKSDDEADIDTIELMLRPEEFARLESIWEAQTQAAASNAAPEPSQPTPESADDELITGPFDVTRIRSEHAETSDERVAARDSTVELPPLRLTPDGQSMALGAAAAENSHAASAERTDSTVALPPLRLTPDGQPVTSEPRSDAHTLTARVLRPTPARTHFHPSAPAPREDSPRSAPVAVQPAPAVRVASSSAASLEQAPAEPPRDSPLKPVAVAVQPAPAVTVVSDSAVGLKQAPADLPRGPLSVEQFGAPAAAALASRPVAVEPFVKAAPITVVMKKPPSAAKAAPSQQARWPWLALSSVAALLAVILVWLFSVDTTSHVKAPAPTPVAPLAPAAPAKAAPVPVPASTPAQEPRQQPAHQQPSAVAPANTVKFTNPFDQREVFEFPAGTSRTEARDAVAQILMQRARDRQGMVAERTRRRASRPSQPSRGAGELVENARRVTN